MKELLDVLGSIEEKVQSKMEERRLKTKKAEFEPLFVVNLRYVTNEYLPNSKKGFMEAIKQSTVRF